MNNARVLFMVVFLGVISCSREPAEVREGKWRAVVKTETGTEIPFNFEIKDSAGTRHLDILNGRERLRVDEISINSDSVNIRMPLFNSEIKAVLNKNGNLYGKFIRHLADRDVEMSFSAQPNVSWRFFNTRVEPRYNVDGRWSVTFATQDGKDTTIAVGEFEQNGSKVTGTFLTRTGDYRFLEGGVSEDKLYLSAFDGSNSYMFTGKLSDKNTITDGKFYSGLTSVKNWSARRDAKAMLPDSYSLTALKPGYSTIDFSFPDLEQNVVSLKDEKFENKVVVVQLFGSWCPNCMDETAYLSSFYDEYRDRGVEVVGLGYEISKDPKKARTSIKRLKDRLNVKYEMLVTGYTNKKDEVMKSLPALSTFVAFPTLIIIDKKGTVRKIHTGFTGPGTGQHYTEFINRFERTIDDLLKE